MKILYTSFLILGSFLIHLTAFGQKQVGKVNGTVFSADEKPISSVTVEVKETHSSFITDENGNFHFELEPGSYTISISFIGLEDQQRKFKVIPNATSYIHFTLKENAALLEQVIVASKKGLNDRNTAIGKIAVSPRDLPQAITVIDNEVLQKQQVLNMTDVLKNANGVYIMGTTGGFKEEIAARGYAFSNSNTFKNGSRFNSGIVNELSSAERIEILKGGSAILFGNVTAGGVLNIVTKKPKFEKGGQVWFRTGSYDFYKPGFDIYGPLGKNNKAAFRLNGTFEKSRSFRDEVKEQRFYINPSFQFNITDKTTLIVEGDYLNDDRTPDYGIGAIDYEVAKLPSNTFLNVPWGLYKTEQYTSTATLTHKINKSLNFRSIISYQYFDNALFAASRPNTGGNMIKEDGTWVRGLSKSATNEQYYFAQADLNATFNTGKINHTFLIGLDADKYNTRSTAFNTYKNPMAGNKNIYDTINVFNPVSKRNDVPDIQADHITTSPIERIGFYIQDLISLNNYVKVLAGIRYSVQNNKTATVDSISKNNTGYIAGNKASAFSPRLGLVFRPYKYTSLFISYTNNFNINSGVDVNNAPLAPSIINQYEAGIKQDWFKGLVSTNLTVYRIHNSNLAQSVLNPPAAVPNAKELAGSTISKGIELDIMTKNIHGFSAIAGYSYNDMYYDESTDYINGSKLRYNPNHTANANLFYSFSNKSKLKGLTIGGCMYYMGERLAGRSTTKANPQYKLMPLHAFTTFDVNASYENANYGVRVKWSNIFNQTGHNAHDDNSVNPIAPRMVSATFFYNF